MIKLLSPDISNIEKYIRSRGTVSLPTGDTFWYEDIPQIPAKILPHPFVVTTDEIGKIHTLSLNNTVHTTFIPDSEIYSLPLILQQGLYDYELKTDFSKDEGSFQISIKELIYWSWIQRMTESFTELEFKESLINNQGNQFLFELIYPNSILNINNTPYALKNYIASSNEINPTLNLLGFASGLFDKSIKQVLIKNDLVDLQDDFSSVTIPLPYSTLSRKKAFSNLKGKNEIKSINSNVVETKRIDNRNFFTNFLEFSSNLTLRSYVPDQKYLPDYFKYRVVSTELDDYNILEFPKIISFTSSAQQVSYGEAVELTANFYNGDGKIDGTVVESGVSYKFYPTSTTTYTLIVSNGAGAPIEKSLTVGVGNNLTINDFSLDNPVVPYGASATLTAIFSGQDAIGTIDGGESYITSGETITISELSTTTLTLQVTNGNETIEQSIILTVLPEGVDLIPTKVRILKNSPGVYLKATFSGEGSVSNFGPVQSGVPFLVSPTESTTYNLVVDGNPVASSLVEVVEDTKKFNYTGQYIETIQRKNSYVNVDAPNFAEWSLYGRQDKYISSINNNDNATIKCISHGFNTGEEFIFKNKKLYYDIQSIIRGSTTVISSAGHKFKVNDKVKFEKVKGMRQINNKVATVIAIGPITDIENITKASPGVVTATSHGLSTGEKVFLSGIEGMTQLNNTVATVTVLTTNTFSIGINTSSFDTYTSGGVVSSNNFTVNLNSSTYLNYTSGGSVYIGMEELNDVKYKAINFDSNTLNFSSDDEPRIVEEISQENPAQITMSNHKLETGNKIVLYNISGMHVLNNKIVTVLDSIDSNTFTIDLDTSDTDIYKTLTGTGKALKLESTSNFTSFPSEHTITNITREESGKVTSANHRFSIGDAVKFNGITNMSQLNGQTATITAVTKDTFTINIDTTDYSTFLSGGLGTGFANNISKGQIDRFIIKGFGKKEINIDDFIEGELNEISTIDQPLNLKSNLDSSYALEYTEGFTGLGSGGKIHIQTSANPSGSFINNYYIENPGLKYKNGEYLSAILPTNMAISSITKTNSVITVHCASQHQLETGDKIKFSELVGITSLNGVVYRIKKINDKTFQLLDAQTLELIASSTISGTYSSGGVINIFLNLVTSSINQKSDQTNLSFYSSDSIFLIDGTKMAVTLSFSEKLNNTNIRLKNIHEFKKTVVNSPSLTLVADFIIRDEISLKELGLNKLQPIEPIALDLNAGENKTIDIYWKKAPTTVDVVIAASETGLNTRDGIEWDLYANAIEKEKEIIDTLTSDVISLKVSTAKKPVFLTNPQDVLTKNGDESSFLSFGLKPSVHSFGESVLYEWYKDGGLVQSVLTPVGDRDITALTKGTTTILTSEDHGFVVNDVIYITNINGLTPSINGETATVTLSSEDTFTINKNTSASTGTFISGSVRGTKLISGITKSKTPVVTCTGHNLSTGSVVKFLISAGMTELNNLTANVTKIDDNSFYIDINTSEYSGTFSSGRLIEMWERSAYDYGKKIYEVTTLKDYKKFASELSEGTYYCSATSLAGTSSISKTSNFANVFSINRPTIERIDNKSSYVGSTFTSTAFASGNANLFYQWRKGGTLKAITNITRGTTTGSSTTVTCPSHGFSTGNVVTFGKIEGMTTLSGLSGTVTNIDANNFSVNIDTSNHVVFPAFISNKTITQITKETYAIITCTSHGFESGDLVVFGTIAGTNASWSALSGVTAIATKINNNKFYIDVNTSGYTGTFSSGTVTSSSVTTFINLSIPTYNEAEFKIESTVSADQGIYFCEVTNMESSFSLSKTSNFHRFTSLGMPVGVKPPIFTLQPKNIDFNIPGTYTFSVLAESVDNGGIITQNIVSGGSGYYSGGSGTFNNVSLTNITNTQLGSGAKATIIVTDGAVTSVTITDHGKNYEVGNFLTVNNSSLGNTGSNLRIKVNSIYTSKISYQWYKDKSIVPGETKPNLTVSIDNPSSNNNGIYYCLATNTRINDNTSASAESQQGKLTYFNIQVEQPLIYDSFPYIRSTPVYGQIAISPPVKGKTTWSLEKDGILILEPYLGNGGGIWTLTPSENITMKTRLWGAGGGSGGLDTRSVTYNNRAGDGSEGGGGGYLEGTVTLIKNNTYTFIVGGGGKVGANDSAGTGGGRGGYNGGGDGANAGPRHSSGSGGGGGGRTEIRRDTDVYAVAAGGGGGGGAGLTDSTNTQQSYSDVNNPELNNGNYFTGYVIPIDSENITEIERSGGSPISRSGDGGGNGGAGSGWLGGLPSNTYIGNDSNGYGGSSGKNGYNPNFFTTVGRSIEPIRNIYPGLGPKSNNEKLMALSAGYQELITFKTNHPKLFLTEESTSAVFTGWTGISLNGAKTGIPFGKSIEERGTDIRFGMRQQESQEGYGLGGLRLNSFDNAQSSSNWVWQTTYSIGGTFPTAGSNVGYREISVRTTTTNSGNGGNFGNGNDGLIIIEPSGSASVQKNRFGIALTVTEDNQAVLVLNDGVTKANETYQWYFERIDPKQVEEIILKKVTTIQGGLPDSLRDFDEVSASLPVSSPSPENQQQDRVQPLRPVNFSTSAVLITGATSPIYTISSCKPSNAGFYYCLVTAKTENNRTYDIKSKQVRLFICTSPEISVQPISVESSSPTATFIIKGLGNGVISYQWFRNGSKISGATGESFSTPDDQGYHCMVTNTLNDVSISKKSETVRFSRTISNPTLGGGGGGGKNNDEVRSVTEGDSVIGSSGSIVSISAGVTPLFTGPKDGGFIG